MIYREDRIWKSVIWTFPVEFITFTGSNASGILDLTRKPEFLDKELQPVDLPGNQQLSTVIADNLLKIYTVEGGNNFILLHIEIQQVYSADVAERMFRYAYRIFDKFQKPLAAWLILTESSGKIRSDVFVRNFIGTMISYRFNTLKIATMKEEVLLASANPFAIIFMAVKARAKGKKIKDPFLRSNYLFDEKIKLVELLYSKRLLPQKQKEILNFINYTIPLENIEIKSKFDQRILKLTNDVAMMTITETIISIAKEEGLEEGLKEGMREGLREGLKEGLQEGLEQGMFKGRVEGELKGKYLANIEIAKRLLDCNSPLSFISKITTLSILEIEQLARN